jgi:hypothetical protein
MYSLHKITRNALGGATATTCSSTSSTAEGVAEAEAAQHHRHQDDDARCWGGDVNWDAGCDDKEIGGGGGAHQRDHIVDDFRTAVQQRADAVAQSQWNMQQAAQQQVKQPHGTILTIHIAARQKQQTRSSRSGLTHEHRQAGQVGQLQQVPHQQQGLPQVLHVMCRDGPTGCPMPLPPRPRGRGRPTVYPQPLQPQPVVRHQRPRSPEEQLPCKESGSRNKRAPGVSDVARPTLDVLFADRDF